MTIVPDNSDDEDITNDNNKGASSPNCMEELKWDSVTESAHFQYG